MPNEKSIIYSNSTKFSDIRFIYNLVDKHIAGNDSHKEDCVQEILNKIHSRERQETYTSTKYIHILYSLWTPWVTELKILNAAQIIECIYYFLWWKHHHNTSFSDKLQFVSEKVLWWKINKDFADVIRIIRNNIAHTISIEWLEVKKKDQSIMESFLNKYQLNLLAIADGFVSLTKEIWLLSIGLSKEDIWFNINPAWNYDYISIK